MVSVEISAPGSPYIGKGRYTIPLWLLRDQKFMASVIKSGLELMAKIDAAPDDEVIAQIGFKWWKMNLRDAARERAKVAVGALAAKKKKLQDEREEILNGPSETDSSVTAQTPSEPEEDEDYSDPDSDAQSEQTDIVLLRYCLRH
ncbi:hypothetical protein C8R44DRAFT_748512 [Mycena epipterygia]|nr:hypothetical protein C8R44DRAFT_748512 [Mycena epipterygia]